MEKHFLKTSRPSGRPLPIFSVSSCLCGDGYEDIENDRSRLSLPLPTISISPILLRRFAPITKYLAVHDFSLATGSQQHITRVSEKDAVTDVYVAVEKMVVKEKQSIKEKYIPSPTTPMLYRRAFTGSSGEQFTTTTLRSSESLARGSATYEYGPLKEDEIRVIMLDDGDLSEDVVIRLEVRKRAALAPYEAVSYVWGERKETGIIKVRTQDDVKTLQVRGNVITMLRRLRQRQYREPLWIDAICINQGLTSEKAAQVQMMGDVYRRASQTLVWLGHHEERLLSNLNHAWPCFGDIENVKMYLEPLLKNPYFTRRWVIQELFFSLKVCLLDRYEDLDFRVLEDASEFILKHIHHLHHDIDDTKDRRLLNALHLMHILRELKSQSTEDHDFMRLLVSAHVSECSEGQDRIYALEALDKTERVVSYETRVEKVFEDFTKAELDSSLETLYCSGAFPDTYTKACEDAKAYPLPSWVPDWRSKRAWIPISLLHGQDVSETSFGPTLRVLSSDQKPEWNVVDSTLLIRGAIIDKVKRVKNLETIGGLLKFYSPSATNRDITRLIKTLTVDAVQDGRIAEPWLKIYRDSNGTNCPLKSHSPDCNHLDSKSLYECNTLRRIEDVMTGRCAFVTEEGYWAVGPYHLEKGDFMVQLDGCRFPFVMRRQANKSWKIVGDCFSATIPERQCSLTQEFHIV